MIVNSFSKPELRFKPATQQDLLRPLLHRVKAQSRDGIKPIGGPLHVSPGALVGVSVLLERIVARICKHEVPSYSL